MLTLCTSESLIWMKIMDTNRENLPEKLTKEWFEKSIDGEWTKSICNVCEIGEEQILRFLVNRRPGKRRNAEQAKNVKCMKAYKFFMDGHVQKLYTCKTETGLTVIKASVLASMRQTLYKVYMCLEDEEGKVLGAYCEGVAG